MAARGGQPDWGLILDGADCDMDWVEHLCGTVVDALDAGPGESFAPHADAIPHRLAIAEHQVKEGVRRVDHDGAGRLLGTIVHKLAHELR